MTLSQLVRGVVGEQRGSVNRYQTSDRHVVIDHSLCFYCGACVAVCPPDSLFLHNGSLSINDETCTRCERCVRMCPVHALSTVKESS
jgi:ferredoxin